MLTTEQMDRLVRLRPHLTNVIGFYGLIEDGVANTPLDGMMYEVHLKASALKIAVELHSLLREVLDEPE